ncbi:MAG: nucleotide-binding protein [Bacteroidota bacterium]
MVARIFIGSSKEGLPIANAIADNLSQESDKFLPRTWDKGIFKLSKSLLENLFQILQEVEFGIFVFTPDDLSLIRGKVTPTVRDNVIFEMGLFMGSLGQERVFFVKPRGDKLDALSDLSGLVYGEYNPKDKKLKPALSGFCNQVSEAIQTSLMKGGVLMDPEGIKEIEADYSIKILNDQGDSIIQKKVTIEAIGGFLSNRNHAIFCYSQSCSYKNLELIAWDEQGNPLGVRLILDSPNRKEVKIMFRDQLQTGKKLTYSYRYKWEGFFPKNELSYFILKSTAEKIFFNLECSNQWDLLFLNAFEKRRDGIDQQKTLPLRKLRETSNEENFITHSYEIQEFDANILESRLEWEFNLDSRKGII